MTLADRIVVMQDGRVEQVGTPLEIYNDPVSYFVADFFGSPSMNLHPGTLRHAAGRPLFQGPGFALPLPAAFASAPEGPYSLGARPEHIRVGGNGSFHWRAKLVEPLGKDTLIYFEHGAERPTIAIVEGASGYRIGDTPGISFDLDRIYLFDPAGHRVRASR
jgi:multiple sugar transport system ATP-binding protein